ncbi:hypothetical protein R6Q59_024879 [Mikania micrantha]
MRVGTPHCIDWGVLADAGEAVRARAILGEDTPWTRLFEIAELPTHRLITAAVREEDDEELPPDIEFSLCGQHFEMSIERFSVHLGIYYEPETVRDDFTQGLMQGEERVIRPGRPRYLIRHSRDTEPCNLARCFALYYASFYHRRERGTLWGGAFVTHIARSRSMVDTLDDLPAIEPRKLDRRTIISMKLAADIPGLGLRFIGSDGRLFQPAQVVIVPEQQEQQQPQDDGAMPDPEPIRSPAREEPPHIYHAVRQTEPLEALLHQIAASATRRLSRWLRPIVVGLPGRHASSDGSIVMRIWSGGRSRQSMRDGTDHSFHRSRSHASTQTTDRPLDHMDRS